jgi:hypothetical protein
MHTRRWWACFLAVLAVAACVRLSAETSGDTLRYELVVKDGKFYRFDKLTGKLEPVALPAEPGALTETAPERVRPARPAPPVNHPPVIKSEPGTKVIATTPDQVAPGFDRQRAGNDINAYRRHLGIIQSLSIQGERIKGLISVTNQGPRRLEVLELTLWASSAPDGEVCLEHRFVLSSQPGQKEPPAPAADPSRPPTAVYINVNLPVPTSDLRKLDVQVTYLKFTGE